MLEQGAVPVGVFSTVAELILIERQHIEQSGRESKILEGAAGKLGGAFKTAFDKHMSEGMNARVAFGVATLEYIKDEQDQTGLRDGHCWWRCKVPGRLIDSSQLRR